MAWSVTEFLCAGIIVFLIVCAGLIFYSQEQFKATATERCEQIIDFNDTKSTPIRNGNYVNEIVEYHGYDVCRSTKDGNITRRKDLGYGTEMQLKTYGMYGRYTQV